MGTGVAQRFWASYWGQLGLKNSKMVSGHTIVREIMTNSVIRCVAEVKQMLESQHLIVVAHAKVRDAFALHHSEELNSKSLSRFEV